MKHLIWALLLPMSAFACNADVACLTWLPSPTAGVNLYRVYRMTGPSYTLIGETAGLLYIAIAQPYGNQCYAVTAVLDGVESEKTNPACKFMRPYAPTDGAIERH